MFVQSEKCIECHGGRIGDISVYGQESNPTTWRLAKMNLAIRGIDNNLGAEAADSFHRDQHKDLKADYVMANPPFNDSDWGGERPRLDPMFEEVTEGEEVERKESLKSKWTALKAIVGTEKRLALIAGDLVEHFERR